MALQVSAPRGRYYPDGANKRLKYTADNFDIPSNKGFMVDVAGTLRCQLRRDSALDDLAVLAGVIYPLDIWKFDKTNSVGPTTLWVFSNI